MKIAHVTRYVSRLDGGVFFALAGLLPQLDDLPDVEVRVFGAADRSTAEDASALAPLPIETYPAWGPKRFGYAPRLKSALGNFSPDVIHTHGLWAYPSLLSLQLHRKSGVPMVITPHGMLDPWALSLSSRQKRFAGLLFQNAQLKRAAVLHALTPVEARSFRAYGCRSPIAIIPNGVAPAAPIASTAKFPALPNERPHVILFLGRLHPKKGLAPLIQAWTDFCRNSPASASWRLQIAGWDEASMIQSLQKLGDTAPTGSLEFPGPLWGANKCAAYTQAEAVILPSLSEGLPIAVLEAWSYGKPVLMTPECNLPEGFSAGAALRIEPNAASITGALCQLAEMSPADRAKLGAAGKALVERDYSWQKIASDMVRLYTAVSEQAAIPPNLAYSER